MSKVSIYDDLKNQSNEKIEAIKKILPDCFDIDGNLIESRLKEVLTNNFEKPDTERFTFNWAGKQKARGIAYQTYTEGTLKFDHSRSKNFDTTQNLIIEGDNLQVLKLLKNSYEGKIKCIYIDPPYNTGQDFVYNDNFELKIEEYLRATGEIDEETGEQIAEYIQKDDGKKHSKWLSFMYPRLMAAKEMLREDGVIFISIDDNEVHHLRLLMNEVFGEDGFIDAIVRKTKSFDRDKSNKEFQKLYDTIFVYCKDKNDLALNQNIIGQKSYPLKDDIGEYKLNPLQNKGPNGYRDRRPKTYYEIYILKNGTFAVEKPENEIEIEKTFLPEKIGARDGCWSWQKSKVMSEQSRIILKNDKLFIKIYKDDDADLNRYTSKCNIIEDCFNANGTSMLTKLNLRDCFSNPKPVELIKWCLELSTSPSDLILDFFAGSGTTGQAVMELNQEEVDKQLKDGLLADKTTEVGGRKFILVQLPEKIDEKKEAYKAGYKKISDITIERVKRAGEKYKSVDNGFKVLQLADNPDREKLWNLGHSNDNEFILTHLALLYGYGLNYKIEKIAEKEIYIMKSEIKNTKDAIVILEKEVLKMEDIMSLVKQFGKGQYKFFSRDSALNVELISNLLQHFKKDNVFVF